MKDSLLKENQKKKIEKLVSSGEYIPVIKILDSVSTSHAGTAKMKDKKFVIKTVVNSIIKKYNNPGEKFLITGKKIISIKSDNAKEVGIHIIRRGYEANKKLVEKYLYKTADDDNWEVREYAAGAFLLTLKEYPEFYKTLRKWSKDKSENIRRAVVMAALGFLDKSSSSNLKNAFSLLEPLLYDSSPYVRKNLGPFVLGSYFGNTYPAETVIQIRKWLKIKDSNVRWNLAMAFNNSFGKRYSLKAMQVLKVLNKDSSRVVKNAVKSTINYLLKFNKIGINS